MPPASSGGGAPATARGSASLLPSAMLLGSPSASASYRTPPAAEIARGHAVADPVRGLAVALRWPAVLALDAPAVIATWYLVVASAFGHRPVPTEALLLGLATWLAYMADRLLDGRRFPCANETMSARHRFAQRHRGVLSVIWCGVAVATCGLALATLDDRTLGIGLAAGVATLLYVIGTYLRPRIVRASVPRELVVGAVFSAGLLIVAGPQGSASSISAFAILALPFAANALVVSCCERRRDAALGEVSSATRWAGLPRVLPVLLLALGFAQIGAVLLASGPTVRLLEAGAAAMFAMAALAIFGRRHPGVAGLADLALLMSGLPHGL